MPVFTTSHPAMPSVATMSAIAVGVAVAVSASTGGLPSASSASPQLGDTPAGSRDPTGDAVRLVDHDEVDVRSRASIARNSGLPSRSGVVITNSAPPIR